MTAAQAAAVRERIVFGFNTFYGDLLSSLAKSDPLMKKRLKKNYRVINRKSDSYLMDMHQSAKECGALGEVFRECPGEALDGLMVARGMKFADIPKAELPTVRLLCAFLWLFGELCAATEEPEEDRETAVTAVNELFERLIESVSRIQAGYPLGDGLDGLVDEEARDIFRATLTNLAAATQHHPEKIGANDVDAMASAFDMMKCSKLGSIVQEISESIDKDELRKAVESGNMMSEGSVEMMSSLFKKVSGAITSKLQNGELSQEDLLRETTNLMNSMR